jgi:hypothetical protein
MDERVRLAKELLVGYRGRRSGTYVAYAVLLAAVTLLVVGSVWAGLAVFEFGRFRSTGRSLLIGVGGLAAFLALLQGYTNDGLLVGLAVAFAPLGGVLLWGALAVGLDLPSPGAGQADFGELAMLGGLVGAALTLVGLGAGRLTSDDPARNVREETPIETD